MTCRRSTSRNAAASFADQASIFSLYDFFTMLAQAISLCKAASFLFWVGTNCARCALHWSTVSAAVVEEAGVVPEAQAVTLSARSETLNREINVFMDELSKVTS